jgi:hypothetical protein
MLYCGGKMGHGHHTPEDGTLLHWPSMLLRFGFAGQLAHLRDLHAVGG